MSGYDRRFYFNVFRHHQECAGSYTHPLEDLWGGAGFEEVAICRNGFARHHQAHFFKGAVR